MIILRFVLTVLYLCIMGVLFGVEIGTTSATLAALGAVLFLAVCWTYRDPRPRASIDCRGGCHEACHVAGGCGGCPCHQNPDAYRIMRRAAGSDA